MIQKPKLLDQVREVMRLKHLSIRTEKSYTHWIKRFIFFHQKRHPAEMGEVEIRQFSIESVRLPFPPVGGTRLDSVGYRSLTTLSDLAIEKNVAPATQNLAMNALVFLYKPVCRQAGKSSKNPCPIPVRSKEPNAPKNSLSSFPETK